MTNRYTLSLLTTVFVSTCMWAQQTNVLQNQINSNNNEQQVIDVTPARRQTPQRVNVNNGTPPPQRQQAPQRSAPQAPVRMGGPNGPGGMRVAAPVRVATAPQRQAGTTSNRGATPQRRAVTTPSRGTTPQRQAVTTPSRGNVQATANSNPPARNINVISSGPNGTGGVIPVIAINVPYRGGPNGSSFAINDNNNVDVNVNPVLSNVIPVQAMVNNGNNFNISRGNQDFVFELNADNNEVDRGRGLRGNMNINVEAPEIQFQAPQINLPEINKVQLPEINLPKISLPEIKRGSGSGSSGGSGTKYKHKASFKSNWKSFKRDVRYKWRKMARKRTKMRYRVAECFFFGC